MSAVTEILTVEMHGVNMLCEVQHIEDGGDIEIVDVLIGGMEVKPLLSEKVLKCIYRELYYRVHP